MRFDWQFVVVTLAALWGGWALLRPLLRLRAARRVGAPACAHCAAGNPCEPASASDTVAPAPAGGGLVSIGSGRKGASPAPR